MQRTTAAKKRAMNMVLAYLLNAVIVGTVCALIWLVSGGSVLMAFLVYNMSGLLAIAATASAVYFLPRGNKDGL